jgi:phage gp45-like
MKQAYINSTGDSGEHQTVEIQHNGRTTKASTYTPYGYDSHCPEGGLARVISSGSEENRVALCDFPQIRPKNLVPGECQITNYLLGQFIKLNSLGQIVLSAGPSSITITPAGIVITAPQVTVNGAVFSTNDMVLGGITYTTHRHKNVQSGPNNTGTPL